MDLKILMVLIIYYSMLSAFFLLGGSEVTAGSTDNVTTGYSGMYANETMSGDEIAPGGLFNAGASVLRFIGFVGLGIGLPADTPSWISTLWVLWQSGLTLFTIGWIVNSVWSG